MSETAEYRSSLEDLKMNSKPQISMLTMLAEDHVQFASDIVRVIEEQIKKVAVNRKLPIMYLIDSIIKNLAETTYPQLFSQCIVQIFCGVFEEVDEKTRASLYKLRQTWVDILPNKQLYLLDRKVQLIDPAWPVTAKAPERGIHVNPKFLKTGVAKEDVSPKQSESYGEAAADDAYKEMLYAKEQELEKLRLQLEMAKTETKLEHQKRQLQLELSQQQVIQQKLKKPLDREPPSLIKLPPANSNMSQPVNRDPRLGSRDPRVNRDPRLQRQLERQQNEQKELEKKRLESASTPEPASTAPKVTSPRMDLASILDSFTSAAAKVAQSQKKGTSPSGDTQQIQIGKEAAGKGFPKRSENTEAAGKGFPKRSESTDHAKSEKRVPLKSSMTKGKERNLNEKEMKDYSDHSPRRDRESFEAKNKSRRDFHPEESETKDVKGKSKRSGKDSEKKEITSKSKQIGKEIDIKYEISDDKKADKEHDVKDAENKGRKMEEDREVKREDKMNKDKSRKSSEEQETKGDIPIKKSTRDRRSETHKNHPSPRKSYGRTSPPTHRSGSHREDHSSRNRARYPGRSPEPEIVSSDGQTDQFGRTLRTPKTEPKTRDRSPLDKDVPIKERDEQKSVIATESKTEIPEPQQIDSVEIKTEVIEEKVTKVTEEEKQPEENIVVDIKEEPITEEINVKEELPQDQKVIPMEESSPIEALKEEMPPVEISPVAEAIEDVDMRVKPMVIKEKETENEQKRQNDVKDLKRKSDEEPDAAKVEARPFKIPKLSAKKVEESEQASADISTLFGAEDVDYRKQLGPPPAATLQSPLQRRWSQFKESHPDDFAQDVERRRLRDAQMGSGVGDPQDEDLRKPPAPKMRNGPLQPFSTRVPIPKDLSPENREQIFRRADTELQEGRISHSEHQEVVRQLDQFYDDHRKHYKDDYPPRQLDMKDPRLRGIRDSRSHDLEDRRPYFRENFDDDAVRGRPPNLPDPGLHREHLRESEQRSPKYDRRESGYPGSPKERFERHRPHRPSYSSDSGYRSDYETNDPDYNAPPRRFRDVADHDDRPVRGGPQGGDFRRPLHMKDNDHRRDASQRSPLYEEVRRDRPGVGSAAPVPPALPGPTMHHREEPGNRRSPPRAGRYMEQEEAPHRPLPGPSLPGRLIDPMDDPRWAPMRGLLDSDGTEEVVIDAKPYELRMGTSRKLRIHGKIVDVAVDLQERGIRFDGQLVYKLGEPIKEVPAAGRTVRLYYHGLPKPIWLDGQQHEMRLDAPPRNVFVDGVRHGFQIDGRDLMILVDRLEKGCYGGPPRKIRIAGVDHDIAFQAPPRRILIDGKSCELKLDTKIPYVIINGKHHGIRFEGEPRLVFINDQPFTIPVDRAEKIKIGPRPTYIAFGGPAHEIIIDGKWFEVMFDNVTKDIHLGNRTFSIRLPGPLPRVKILQELAQNTDESRLMSTHGFPGQPAPPQPQQASVPPMQPEPSMPGASAAIRPPDGMVPIMPIGQLDGARPPLGPQERPRLPMVQVGPRVPQGQPGAIRMPSGNPEGPRMPPGNPEGPRISLAQPEGPRTQLGQPNAPGMPVINPGVSSQIGPVLNRPPISAGIQIGMMTATSSQPGSGQMGSVTIRPAGEGVRGQPFGQAASSFFSPSSQHTQMLIRQPGQPQMAVQKPGMRPIHQPVNNPRVSYLAQGILNQVASNMIGLNNMGNHPGNIGNLAAGLRALTQLGNVMPMQQQPQLPFSLPQPLRPSIPRPVEDHGPAMATGMQGVPFTQVPRVTVPAQVRPPPGLGLSVSGPTVNLPGKEGMPPTVTLPSAAGDPASTISQSSEASSVTTSAAASAAPALPVDVNSLLSNLLKIGLIKDPSKPETTVPTSVTNSVVPSNAPLSSASSKSTKVDKDKPFIPDFTSFQLDALRKPCQTIVDQLHKGIQCHTCATRFLTMESDKYRAHLDWHFRQNKMEQEMDKVAKNRKWFYTIPEWIQYEELENTEEKSRSEIFEQMKSTEISSVGAVPTSTLRALEGKDVIRNPVASGIEGEDICATCGDPFDQMWNEETEEWILKNTIKVDGKTYHPVCYEDVQETPTPIDAPVTDPLSVQEQCVEPEVEISVKEEPSSPQPPSLIKQDPVEPVDVVVKVEPEELAAPNLSPQLLSTSEQKSSVPMAEGETVKVETESDFPASAITVALTEPTAQVSTVTNPNPSQVAPLLLGNIASAEREVIPVSQDDPMSPWAQDSNPTPELSRTPSPEQMPSFTPLNSASAEPSTVDQAAVKIETLSSEDPLIPSTAEAKEEKKEAVDPS